MRSTEQSDEFVIEDSYGRSSLVESTKVAKKSQRVRKDKLNVKAQSNCCQNNCLVF
jgi:hypothetical protein